MNLHIELDSAHPAYEWLEKQADKIVAKGHFGTHIDSYTSTPTQNEYYLPTSTYIVDCQEIMPSIEDGSKERITITVHIDTKINTPGVIDKRTGVTIVLLLTELLKDYSGKYPIELVIFNGEDYFRRKSGMPYTRY